MIRFLDPTSPHFVSRKGRSLNFAKSGFFSFQRVLVVGMIGDVVHVRPSSLGGPLLTDSPWTEPKELRIGGLDVDCYEVEAILVSRLSVVRN